MEKHILVAPLSVAGRQICEGDSAPTNKVRSILIDHFIPRQSHGTSLTVVWKLSINVTSRYDALPRNAVRSLSNILLDHFILRQGHGTSLSISLLDLAGSNYLGIPENFYCHPGLDPGSRFYFMLNRREYKLRGNDKNKLVYVNLS
jgi:hypothetical protein